MLAASLQSPEPERQSSSSVSGNVCPSPQEQRSQNPRLSVRAFGERGQPGLKVCEQLTGRAVA